MTESKTTTKTWSGKAAESVGAAEWLDAAKRIEHWLSGAGRPLSVGTKHVKPPTDGECGSADLEELVDRATSAWAAKQEASPEVYAARELGTWRKTQKRRRERGVVVVVDSDAVDRSNAPANDDVVANVERARRMARPPAQRTATLSLSGVGDLTEIKPEDLEASELESRLLWLGSDWNLASTRDYSNARLRAVADVLMALRDPGFDISKIAGVASDYLKKHNRGPRSRSQEADALARIVVRRDAVEIVGWLRVMPRLAAGTCGTSLPVGAAWPEEEKRATLETIQREVDEAWADALDRERKRPGDEEADPERDAVAMARAVLRAVGHPDPKGAYAHIDQRRARRRAGST